MGVLDLLQKDILRRCALFDHTDDSSRSTTQIRSNAINNDSTIYTMSFSAISFVANFYLRNPQPICPSIFRTIRFQCVQACSQHLRLCFLQVILARSPFARRDEDGEFGITTQDNVNRSLRKN
jgi:hypothetical protein